MSDIEERRGMYGESMYLTSGTAAGATGATLAATQGISGIALILLGVTVVFSAMLVVRITRRAARRFR